MKKHHHRLKLKKTTHTHIGYPLTVVSCDSFFLSGLTESNNMIRREGVARRPVLSEETDSKLK